MHMNLLFFVLSKSTGAILRRNSPSRCSQLTLRQYCSVSTWWRLCFGDHGNGHVATTVVTVSGMRHRHHYCTKYEAPFIRKKGFKVVIFNRKRIVLLLLLLKGHLQYPVIVQTREMTRNKQMQMVK